MSEDFHEFSREAEDERLKQQFRDFLIAPEISGATRTFTTSRRIPAERITDSGDIVEISQEIHDEDTEHNDSSVMIHRNEANDITAIEITCSCGRKTMIRLENDFTAADDPGEDSRTYGGRLPMDDEHL